MELQTYFTLLTHLIYIVVAYQEEYRGFDNCGNGGWHCKNSDGNGLEISYQCPNKFESARLWLWTARIPSSAVSYVIQDCDHVELHIDCTMGYRSYSLRKLHVRNVRHLEILKPLRPQIFLHDNDQVPQAPPEFFLTNVKRVTWFPGVFDKAGGRCRTKQQFLQTIYFTNVTLPDFQSGILKDNSLENLIFQNVTIESIEKRAVNVSASSIHISDSQLKLIDDDAITISADNVVINGNTFMDIKENGLTILSQNFLFLKNNVKRIFPKGLTVKSHQVKIHLNTFEELGNNAFANIEPGEKWFEGYKTFSKFKYEFSGNEVVIYYENSLLPNYSRYQESCSEVIIENNQVGCNCQVPHEGLSQGDKKWWKGSFPELLGTSNRCLKTDISILLFLEHCQHSVCGGTSTIQECMTEITDTSTTEVTDTSAQPNTDSTFFTLDVTEAILPLTSENFESKPVPALHKRTMATILWTVFGTLFFLAISGGIAYWGNKRRKENIIKAMNSYKHTNQRNALDDHEILMEGSGEF